MFIHQLRYDVNVRVGMGPQSETTMISVAFKKDGAGEFFRRSPSIYCGLPGLSDVVRNAIRKSGKDP